MSKTTKIQQTWLERELSDPETRRVFEQERLAAATAAAIGDTMEATGKSKAELAATLGCTRSYVTQVLGGNRNITLHTLSDLAWALDSRVEFEFIPFDILDFRPLPVDEPTIFFYDLNVEQRLPRVAEMFHPVGDVGVPAVPGAPAQPTSSSTEYDIAA